MSSHSKGGRRPTSNFLKGALSDTTAVVLPKGIPEPPEFLTGPSLQEWNRICGLLHGIGLLSEISRPRIARYVQAWETYQQVQREWNKMPLKDKLYPKPGKYDPYYWMKLVEISVKEINAFESEYGLTPLSSGRIVFPKGQKDTALEKFDAFLNESHT